MRRTLIGIFAFLAGVISLFATQIALTKAWGVFGVQWGRDNLPTLPIQQVAALSTVFAAVLVGSFIAAFLSRRDALRVLALMCFIGMAVDGYAMFVILKDALPLWFRAGFVAQIPLATVLAGLLWTQTRSFRA